MSKFIPRPGMLAYITVLPREHTHVKENGELAVVTQQDNSYSDQVFRCIAADDTHVLAKCVFGGWLKDPQLFKLSRYRFDPVGPEIARALNLE